MGGGLVWRRRRMARDQLEAASGAYCAAFDIHWLVQMEKAPAAGANHDSGPFGDQIFGYRSQATLAVTDDRFNTLRDSVWLITVAPEAPSYY